VPFLIAALIALSITTACTPALLRWAPRVGLTDRPGTRKVHETPVPRVGGIAMAAGILIPTLLSTPMSRPVLGFLGGALVLLAFGVWDDRADLNYRLKFLGQFVAVGLCMIVGDVRIEWLTLAGRVMLPEPLSWALTFVFLVGVTNAMNLSDGLDGLAGGLALLCLCALAILGTITGNTPVTAIALIESGAILGFLRFNMHPARVFMGDGGSQMLGFSIGVLAILATQRDGSALSAALPLLLLGLPILDTLTVMIRRAMVGRSPFSGDRNHIHHRLLDLGFAHHEAVILAYVLQLGLFLLAYSLRFESDLLIAGAFTGFAIAVLILFHWATRTGWRAHAGRALPLISFVLERLRRPESSQLIERLATWTMGAGLVGYAVVVVFAGTHVGGDISLLSGALLLLLVLISYFASAGAPSWAERLAVYVGVMLLVYLDETAVARGPILQTAPWIFIAVSVAAAIARLMFSATRRFEVTPLDVLVAFVAVVVPNLPGFVSLPSQLPAGILKAVLLLYVVEMLDGVTVQRMIPRAVLAVMLAVVTLRGVPGLAW
jgi:UDP-GlcNAc:undecaprenyl-phosphate/decaprenyl-phosphate GlcNAc-1-phosphate transferase